MQKGYWGDPGQWKVSLEKDATGLRISCRIKGSDGAVMAYSDYGWVQDDGPLTYVGCRRTGNRVDVMIDGSVRGTAYGPTGYVASSKPMLLGSKGLWIASNDQFYGLMDRAWMITYD